MMLVSISNSCCSPRRWACVSTSAPITAMASSSGRMARATIFCLSCMGAVAGAVVDEEGAEFQQSRSGGRLISGARQNMPSDFEQKGHRAVVDQMHLHVGTEAAAGDRRMLEPGLLDQQLEQRGAQGWRRRCGKTRAQTVARVGCQGELRDQQQAAADIAERQVHLAVGIAEYPVVEQLVQQLGDAGD